MSVTTLAETVAQAKQGAIPCRTYDSELWFAEEQADIDRAQRMCRACPLQAACLSDAIERKEPWGVWGGELFERGQVVAQKKPKGRPRKDAELIEQRAEARLAQRLNDVAVALNIDAANVEVAERDPASTPRLTRISGAA